MHKTHMNGFILGNQKALARKALGEERQKREPNKPPRGSWWVGLDREQFAKRSAEVFPDIQGSVEGQKNLRNWRDTVG